MDRREMVQSSIFDDSSKEVPSPQRRANLQEKKRRVYTIPEGVDIFFASSQLGNAYAARQSFPAKFERRKGAFLILEVLKDTTIYRDGVHELFKGTLIKCKAKDVKKK